MNNLMRLLSVATMIGLLASAPGVAAGPVDVNGIAESYVKLVLEVGLYDADYVDAYYGPAEWKPAETQREESFPAEKLRSKARELTERLTAIDTRGFSGLEKQRHAYLEKQLRSVSTRIGLLAGRKMSFDEESKGLYDTVAPACEGTYFQGILDKLADALPKGDDEDLYWRFNSYRARFTIPQDRLEKVLRAAIAEYRNRTQSHLSLPQGETFDLQFVRGKPWGAAAMYKGNGLSAIEVNSQMPFGVADIHKLAGHEVYPGHHLHLSLLDQRLVQDRKWVEYTVLPLYSPLAMISEGLAEYGWRDLVMTPGERVQFDRTILFPLAGLDPNQAENYRRVMALKDELDGAVVEAARRYLDGRMTRDEAGQWLRRFSLTSPGGINNMIQFIEKYRSYVVTYTAGRRLVREWIAQHSGPNATAAQRWQLFYALLSTPQIPSRLVVTKR